MFFEVLSLKRHSRMANSFLWHGSVEQKQHILTKDDTYKICRSCFGLSKNSKKGAKRRGQRHLRTQEYWVRPRKSGKFWFFHSRGMKMKGGGQKGGREKWVQKGGQPFRMLVPIKYIIIWSSDESFRGHISIFWHNHYGISDIAICPPFAHPLFQFFYFWKKWNFTFYQNQKSISYDVWFQRYDILK